MKFEDFVKFCTLCGGAVTVKTPEGDHAPRHVCTRCGHIHYFNPRVIVGCIPEWTDGRILMCRRNIEPRRGLWTFPAGFLELGETTSAGAVRETHEEAQAEVEPGRLLAMINVPYVSQVYAIYHGRLKADRFGPTPESSEVRLMREDEIPWDEIAFPTIYNGLKFFFEDRKNGVEGFHTLDLTYRPRRPQDGEVTSGPTVPAAKA